MRWLLLAESVVVGGGMAWVRRYGVEPESVGLTCQAATAPWWCEARLALILAVHHQLIGYVAFALGCLALFAPQRLWARLAMDVGAAGLAFYNVAWAAAGFILGLLVIWDRPSVAPTAPQSREEAGP
jgi:hypothetical protein